MTRTASTTNGRPLSWQILEHGAHEAWDTVMQASSDATFFQSRPWAELIGRTFTHWRPAPVVLEFSDGNVMVLPMMRHRLGYRECMPPHVYGGPISLRPPTSAHLEAIGKAATWFPDVTLVENPFARVPREQDGMARWRLSTTAIDLSPGFDALWKRFRDSHRRHVRSAEKDGLTMELATSSRDVAEYDAIYRDSLRRWGDQASGFYPSRLFSNMIEMQEHGQTVRLLLARSNGAVVGGIIVLHHGAQAIYWHGVSAQGPGAAHASPFLLASAIRDACSDGLGWFDLMGPNDHLKGVQHFKDGFATRRLPYDAYYSTATIRGILFKRYRRLRETRLRRSAL